MTGNVLLPGARERAWSPGDEYERRPSGIWVPPELAPEPKPLAVGLFCGAGGMDLGLTYAGFHVGAASDGWATAAHTYLTNLGGPDTIVHLVGDELPEGRKKESAFHREHAGEAFRAAELFELLEWSGEPGSGWIAAAADHRVEDHACGHAGKAHPDDDEKRAWFHDTYCLGGRDYDAQPCEHFYLGDVCALAGGRILGDLGVTGDEIGVVAGGPPCQGFSISGKRQRDDPRNELVFEFMRVCCEIHPRAFLMENVPGMVNMVTKDGVPVIDALSLMAEDGGMGTFESIRKTLLETAGVGAALRTRKATTSDKQRSNRSGVPSDRLEADEDEIVADTDDQLTLSLDGAEG